MIDWLDITIQLLHDPIPAGRVMAILSTGETEYDIPKRMQIAGSYESKIWIRSQGGTGDGRATELYISGNPAKFLQGHNVFGCEDVPGLAAGVIRKICNSVDLPIDLAVARALAGEFEVKRIDITRSFAFADRKEVQAVLAAMAIKSRSRMGRAQSTGGTVYHGKNSSRHTFKFYCKAEELEAGKKHRLPEGVQFQRIKQYAENLFRAELTLRSKELNEIEISRGGHFTKKVIDCLYWEYFGRVEMSAQAEIPSDQIMALSRAVRSSYLMWLNGVDVRPMMSKPSFYRHRADILKFDVDIALPNENTKCQVIPLFRQVTGSPVSIPPWAYEQGLIYDPNMVGE